MSLSPDALAQLKSAYQEAVKAMPNLKAELARANAIGAPVADLQTRLANVERMITNIATHYPEVKSV